VGHLQIRLSKARPSFVPLEYLVANQKEFVELVSSGALQIKTADGRPFDVASLNEAVPVPVPLPNFLPDSVQQDNNGNRRVLPLEDVYEDGIAPTNKPALLAKTDQDIVDMRESAPVVADKTEVTPEEDASVFQAFDSPPVVEKPVEAKPAISTPPTPPPAAPVPAGMMGKKGKRL